MSPPNQPITPLPRRADADPDARIAAAVREILIALGEDPDREGLHDTPRRVARALREMTSGLQ
ncbi:MAG TPA: GTP cyclohydrolase I, partial [Kofleriaceae bacterium]|nr:GTP cyclohydrolase I [Kofleriaceae bacterium]